MTHVNFSALMREQSEADDNSWRNIYDFNLSLPQNLLSILSSCVFLPYDFYSLVAVYYLCPSALCRVLPYLFIFGVSGSGKTNISKIARHLHGVQSESSGDTFAGIRNSLRDRKYGTFTIPEPRPAFPDTVIETEVNTIMVWDDVDPSVFITKPDIYRLFKFGYDRSTDKIEVSSNEIGKNEVFHCFCPKVLSSIHPLHTDTRFKELHRRLLVVPTQKIEDIHPERKQELGICNDSWQDNILDVDTIAWKGFKQEFTKYWDEQRSRNFLVLRKEVARRSRGLTATQRVISLDLITTGVICGIWKDIKTATDTFKDYFAWLEQDQEKFGDTLTQLLKSYLAREEENAKKVNTPVEIYTRNIKAIVDSYAAQGLLMERPSNKEVRIALSELGYRLKLGKWIKT